MSIGSCRRNEGAGFEPGRSTIALVEPDRRGPGDLEGGESAWAVVPAFSCTAALPSCFRWKEQVRHPRGQNALKLQRLQDIVEPSPSSKGSWPCLAATSLAMTRRAAGA